MTKNEKEFILENIKKSGYPLEIEVSSILEKDWFVVNNAFYLDKISNKEREIDILANNPFSKHEGSKIKFLCTITLIVECKKSNTHAWVFFFTSHKISSCWYATNCQPCSTYNFYARTT